VRAAEGRVPFRGYTTWYRVVGDEDAPGKLPLLCLHGGPGAPHDYLEPLEALARTGRRVVFYDQLGCGNSDQPDDESLWTVETFVDEVDAVRGALQLEEVHVFGNSWGGMLALEYALTHPDGLQSLVVSSSPSSIPMWAEEANRLRSELPKHVQRVLDEADPESPEYHDAELEFYRRHVCRVDPWPDCVQRTFDRLAAPVYNHMQGPNEFVITGTLKHWDITSRLPEIDVPTLVTSGRYDECTPRIAETVQRWIPGAEWVVFAQSSHLAFVEEPKRYLAVLDAFLARVEAWT